MCGGAGGLKLPLLMPYLRGETLNYRSGAVAKELLKTILKQAILKLFVTLNGEFY